MSRTETSRRARERTRLYGVFPAIVTRLDDPHGQGRVKIRMPWAGEGSGAGYEAWARLAVPLAGADRGTWLIPDVDDEVLIAFGFGDPRLPYVVGSLWNGQDAPPEEMDSSQNNDIKSIVSRSGIRITLDDASGSERLHLATPGGQEVLLDDGGTKIEVRDSSGNTITLDPEGISLTAASKVTVDAGQVEINAGMVQVNAGMSKFSGVVQADTVITNSVVSSSYTPGAGNVW